jgi:NAD(P)-dependent dehydrogenase (short-subunit alcohol dehydrogenase family)
MTANGGGSLVTDDSDQMSIHAAPDEHTLRRLFGLAGKTAIVTGASSGFGVRFARVLHAAGANVVPVARRVAMLNEHFGGIDGFLPMACDVTVPEDRQRVVEACLQTYGSVDVLVNNAGIGIEGTTADDPIQAFRHVLEVDLLGLYALSLAVAEPMRAQGGGSIINISSVFGLVAGAPIDDAAYCAAKGGVVNLTRQLGARWARRGIRVNSIAPGFFMTEISQATLETDASRDFIGVQCPIGRLGEVAELDAALLFLAGAGSSYTTGHTLVVDGGWIAR